MKSKNASASLLAILFLVVSSASAFAEEGAAPAVPAAQDPQVQTLTGQIQEKKEEIKKDREEIKKLRQERRGAMKKIREERRAARKALREKMHSGADSQ